VRKAGHLRSQVLDHERHPGERRVAVDRRRFLCRLVETRGHEGVQRRVALFCPCDRDGHHLGGVDLAGADRSGHRHGVMLVEQPVDVRAHMSPCSTLDDHGRP
jgi:hypothetical protein